MLKEKIDIDSWYTPEKLKIEYDGKVCTVLCGERNVCPHEEKHANYLKEIFDKVPFETRERIIKWLSKNDFEDLVREIYDDYCSDCWGTEEAGEDDDGNQRYCHCAYEAEQAKDADARWVERGL